MTDLAEHLAKQYQEPEALGDEETSAPFIEDDGKANWAFRVLAGVQAEMVSVRQQAEDQRALIAEWEKGELDRLAERERFFEGALADYWRRQLEPEVEALMAKGLSFDEAWAKVKAKSRKLPAGTLSATKGRESIQIEDDEGFVAWARENALYGLLNTRYTPSKDALAEYGREDGHIVTPDGEKIPGVQVVTQGVTYKAKPVTG